MEPTTPQLHRSGILELDGALTIQRINELKALLQESLSNMDHVVLDLGGVSEVDLSFLQLLCSAHRSARRGGKRLMLAGNQPHLFDRFVERAGYARHMGCQEDQSGECLWMKGKEDE